jgi:hypothetical protein
VVGIAWIWGVFGVVCGLEGCEDHGGGWSARLRDSGARQWRTGSRWRRWQGGHAVTRARRGTGRCPEARWSEPEWCAGLACRSGPE